MIPGRDLKMIGKIAKARAGKVESHGDKGVGLRLLFRLDQLALKSLRLLLVMNLVPVERTGPATIIDLILPRARSRRLLTEQVVDPMLSPA